MPKVYDCFTYYNEELLLSLRLEALADTVDTFVIAEAPFTHTGKPKPLYFSREKFQKFSHKIVHLVVDDMPLKLNNPMANENHQRNALLRGLVHASLDDRVIISDIDEIPHPDAIRRYRPWYLYGTFVQRFYCYFLNNLAVTAQNPPTPRWWIRPKITTMGHLANFFKTPQNVRLYTREQGLAGFGHYLHRKLRHQRLHNGGWHFSWLMSPEEMITKIESVYETQFDQPQFKSVAAIQSAIREGRDILGKGERFTLVPIDESFPHYLVDNLDRFRNWYIDPTSHVGET